jgi:hypothetical protein
MGITALLIIQALILFVCIRLLELSYSNKNQNNPSEQQISLGKVEGFKTGSLQTWNIINVSLFKMWNEMDILDYDSLLIKLKENVQALYTQPGQFEEWSKKYNSYLTEHQHDNNDN